MARNDMIVGKGVEYKGKLSELDKARRDYDRSYTLEMMGAEEAQVTFNAVRIGKKIKSKNGKGYFAVMELLDDAEKQKTTVFGNFMYDSEKVLIRSNHEFFPIIAAVAADTESRYFEVDYEKLQEAVKDITSITVSAKEAVEENNYVHFMPVVEAIEMKGE